MVKNQLVRFSPIDELFKNDVFTRLDEFVDTVFNQFARPFNSIIVSDSGYPKIDLLETNENYIIEASVPGMTKDKISVTVKDGILKITGEKRSESEDSKGNYLCRELKKSAFARTFNFDDKIEEDKIKCKLDNGILTVTVPKKKEVVEEAKFKEIKIEE